MEINNGQLLKVDEAFGYLASQETSAWYQVTKNLQRMAKHLEAFNESRKAIIDKYAEKDEEGQLIIDNNSYQFGENSDKFVELWNELVLEKIDVDFYTFPYSKFESEKLDPVKIAPLMELEIITDEED